MAGESSDGGPPRGVRDDVQKYAPGQDAMAAAIGGRDRAYALSPSRPRPVPRGPEGPGRACGRVGAGAWAPVWRDVALLARTRPWSIPEASGVETGRWADALPGWGLSVLAAARPASQAGPLPLSSLRTPGGGRRRGAPLSLEEGLLMALSLTAERCRRLDAEALGDRRQGPRGRGMTRRDERRETEGGEA